MNHDKIRPRHLERIAFVYLRQSSPGQVKRNTEGRERQLRMQDRAQELGWPAAQVRLLGDPGQSGSSLHGRSDYVIMLEAVIADQAGLICARELSRLARDNQDWSALLRICRYKNVLLADEHRVYDVADPQDRVMLGIHGTFNEYELSMITDRMQQSLRQKAERGEQYDAFPPGYVCRQGTIYEKHPDERVQRAIEKIFEDFESLPSVLKLQEHLLREGFLLPVVAHGKDWRDVEWVGPGYARLLQMLRNPAYAGIYTRGRKKTVPQMDDQGHVTKRRCPVPREEWDVFLEGHHEPYISQSTWQRNMEKIASNAQRRGALTRRAVQSGTSLLTGLLRCHRCGRKLYTQYSSAGRRRYECRGGAKQRQPLGSRYCLRFAESHLDERLSELILQVLRPAGIEASIRAAEHLMADHQRQRQAIADRVQACREAEARAAREYKATDSTYATVRRKLGQEWEASLLAVQREEQRLSKFDQDRPLPLMSQQRAELERLGANLRRVWNHPGTSNVLKKQIVRTLIEEIVVDVEEARDEVVLWIHWVGGHHTQWHEPQQGPRGRLPVRDLKAMVTTLRKALADKAIAATLNREQIRTARGDTWTSRRVKDFRREHQIPSFSEHEKATHGWLTQSEAATRLGISPMSMTRLVQAGLVPAEQPHPHLPSIIQDKALSAPEVQRAVDDLKSSRNRPLPQDPMQLSLFTTTKS
jgi:DNA invertase Pin-like site-specific DNA recombinase